MSTIAIVILSNLSIAHCYQADAPQQSTFGGPWGRPSESTHVIVPIGFNISTIKAEKNEDGDIIIVEDPVKKTQLEEQLWHSFRQERNKRLADCDWSRLDDAPLTNKQRADYSIYRQELRDLPAITTDPQNPSWPSVPS